MKGINWMPRDLKVSHFLIANMILFVDIRNILKFYIMASSLAHSNTGDDSFAFFACKVRYYRARYWQVSCVYILVCTRKIFLSILMSNVSQHVDHSVT